MRNIKKIALAFLASLSLFGSALAQQPNFGLQVGPGTSLNASVFSALYPYGMLPMNVAALPTCALANVGAHAFVNNANSPAFNTTLVGGGAIFIEAHCTYTAASTYAWIGF
jgi:hypothetical protein